MTAMYVAGRPLPQLTELNSDFWTSGATGVLRIQRCVGCERLVHPPALRCPHDHGLLRYVSVSGYGRVESWTESQHEWFPGFPARYLVAFVTLVEDERLRLLTNLVDVSSDDVTVGMSVRVTFEHHAVDDQDIYVPLFVPAGNE